MDGQPLTQISGDRGEYLNSCSFSQDYALLEYQKAKVGMFKDKFSNMPIDSYGKTINELF